jgi:F0F1-type ATP synthase membrane subunit b/b'
MLEVIVSFLIGLSIGLVILAVLLKRQVGKTVPTFFDERQYKRIQKDLDDTLEKIRNIG